MPFEIKDMSGAIFKNNRREKETHPNATGSCKILGVEYEIAAWTKRDKNGNPWQSLSFQRKDAKNESPRQTAERKVQEMDEDVPF